MTRRSTFNILLCQELGRNQLRRTRRRDKSAVELDPASLKLCGGEKGKMYRTPPMKPDVSRLFFVFFEFKYHLRTSYVMPSYDRSSHSPIQVAVNIFCICSQSIL